MIRPHSPIQLGIILIFFVTFFLGITPAQAYIIEPKLQIPIPQVQFSEAATDPETGILSIPHLADYVSGLYSYLVGIAGIIAIAMIMYGGMTWIFAGGGEGIKKAKEIIVHALIGLVLALGSYVILFTLNPDLVSFKALELQTIARLPFPEIDEGDVVTEGGALPPGVVAPTWRHDTFNCDSIPPEAGVLPLSSTVRIPDLPNIDEGGQSVHASLLAPLEALSRKIGEVNEVQGKEYLIAITSGYRSYGRQVELWCGQRGSCFKKYPSTQERKKFCAVPGFSNHGYGIALDVVLLEGGSLVTNVGSVTQCDFAEGPIGILANLFFAADPGWVRYEREIWHFEYNPTTTEFRGQYTGYPAKCR
jgi:hypothetical protein